MDDPWVLARLKEHGLELPAPPAAVGAYVPVRVAGATAFVAGQIPNVEGVLLHPGLVGDDVTVADAAEAARRGALQALAALRGALGGFGTLAGIAHVTVFVASAPGFTEQPAVADGASELFVDVLGDTGRHARAAVGVAALPRGSSVEVAVIAELEP